MRLLKIGAAVFLVGVVILLASGCSSGTPSGTATRTQMATVQKGSISLSVTGTGSLALARTEDLAFEIAGTVESVLVEAGETVKEGQELVKLDTSEWDKQLKKLDNDLVTAERNLVKAERQITAKELAVRQAELDLKSTEYNASQIAAVKTAQDAVDSAQFDLKFAQMVQAGVYGVQVTDFPYWSQQVTNAAQKLAQAQKELQDVLAGSSTKVSGDVALQIAKSQLQVEQSKRQVEDAQIALTDSKLARDDASEAVEDATSALKEAKALSPIIKAPFDGFITKVNVEGGDNVQKGTVAMQLADPSKFEANILVTEKDVFSVRTGGDATVSLDALSGLSFPARIAKVAPLATTQQGVVNYRVTVELTSLQPVGAGQLTSSARASQSANGTSPFGAGRAFQGMAGANQTFGGMGPRFSGNTTSSVSVAAVSLKDGLSAVVNIIVQQKDNVLLVPNRAITRQGQNSTVQVVTANGNETRVVRVGMSDNLNSEILEGLSEGDQVVYTTSTSSTSGTTRTNIMPGMGGIRIP